MSSLLLDDSAGHFNQLNELLHFFFFFFNINQIKVVIVGQCPTSTYRRSKRTPKTIIIRSLHNWKKNPSFLAKHTFSLWHKSLQWALNVELLYQFGDGELSCLQMSASRSTAGVLRYVRCYRLSSFTILLQIYCTWSALLIILINSVTGKLPVVAYERQLWVKMPLFPCVQQHCYCSG